MLSSTSQILSPSLPSPPDKPFNVSTNHRLPISKGPILIRNLRSRRELGGGMRRTGVSGRKNAAEPARIRAVGAADDGVEEEEEAASSDGEGFEATLNRMSKWILAALFVIFILWRHDAEALWVAMGSVVNSCLSVTLKQVLNHERPVSALRSDPGMPSSHAQSLFYTAFYLVMSLSNWLGMNIFTTTVGTLSLVCCSYLSCLRVSQQFHTIDQVVVGAALGSACGATWFWMWHSFVLPSFIASIWVRIGVVLGSVSLCAAFAVHVIQDWLGDEQ
ncbi:lipid phosphate phosphatase epsilon 2, chloroplastic-like isoform X1 [Iris pallida]|uniref:Lipid phosphate phosphatase epsilon 2, chloroplastic-like isoform X1 n=1 Tax=Iris pallida TaxID=29817 RepID=A0AAX6G3G5_IRIPA|nr:lipid phosphate phosphatase epsilon 2, chloroplastic-like isoform X1 [Iris pallida]